MTGQTAHAGHATAVATSPIPRLELIICEASSRSASVRLAERVDEAVTLRPDHVIVDLTACDSLSAAAIGVLTDAHRRVRRYGGRLSLRGAGPRVRRLLDLSGVGHVFDLLPAGGPPRTATAPS
jgi:anti-sigma B factor antagonist